MIVEVSAVYWRWAFIVGWLVDRLKREISDVKQTRIYIYYIQHTRTHACILYDGINKTDQITNTNMIHCTCRTSHFVSSTKGKAE